MISVIFNGFIVCRYDNCLIFTLKEAVSFNDISFLKVNQF